MNARPGPLEGLAMFTGGVVVLALMFAAQAGAFADFDASKLLAAARGQAEVAQGGGQGGPGPRS